MGLHRLSRSFSLIGILMLGCLPASVAQADTYTTGYSSARVLQEALATPNNRNLYDNDGLNFSSGFFSGLASGRAMPVNTPNLDFDHLAELSGDQNVYAVMIDGRYDLNQGQALVGALHPYLSGGMGVAMYGQSYGASSAALQNGQVAPLVRVGGGLAYHVSDSVNLSLDYNAGLSTANDAVAVGRGNQMTDMQIVNMGMHFSF